MNTILEDSSREAEVAAFEANRREFFGTFRLFPQADAHDGPEQLWTVTSVQWAMINSVLFARLEPKNAIGAIDAAVRRGASRGVPILWHVGASDTPGDLGRLLETHGFQDIGEMPIMALSLAQVESLDPPPKGVVVERVADGWASSSWAQITATCFEIPTEAAADWREFWGRVSEELGTRFIRFLGMLDGEPVAASAALMAAGVAGIYAVATLPKARKQGLGTALTLAGCCEARALGYRVATLEATEMGVGIYEKMGFRRYDTTRLYVWTPQT